MNSQEIKEKYAELRKRALSGEIGKEVYERELAILKQAAEKVRAAQSAAQTANRPNNQGERKLDNSTVPRESRGPLDASSLPENRKGVSLRDAIEQADKAVEQREAKELADALRKQRRAGSDRRAVERVDRRDPNNQIGPPRGLRERRNTFLDRRDPFAIDRRSKAASGAGNPAISLEIGSTIAERYTLITQISNGSIGELWRAYDQENAEDVFIRFLPKAIGISKRAMIRLRQVFKTASALKLPGIVPVREFSGDIPGFAYYVSAYQEGTFLDKYYEQFMEGNDRFFITEIARILGPIAKGLDQGHRQNLLHREIRPQNILVGPQGGQLLDFALLSEVRASIEEIAVEDNEAATAGKTGFVLESEIEQLSRIVYLAPEEIEGKTTGPSSDQYSLAVIAYELLCGHLPFRAKNLSVLKDCIRSERPAVASGQSERINEALQKALAKEPGDRFTSCTQFIAVLAGSITNDTMSVRDAGIRSYVPIPEEGEQLDEAEQKSLQTIASKANASSSTEMIQRNRRRKMIRVIYRTIMLVSMLACAAFIAMNREKLIPVIDYWIKGGDPQQVDSGNGDGPVDELDDPDSQNSPLNSGQNSTRPQPDGAGRGNNSVAQNIPAGSVQLDLMGVSGTGQRFAFVVDRSNEMAGTGTTALQLAKSEIPNALALLGEHQQFRLVFFNENQLCFPSTHATKGDIATHRNAENFMQGISPQGTGDLYEAISEAMKDSPDNIFIVISSKTPGIKSSSQTLLRQLVRGVKINIIEIGPGPAPSVSTPMKQFAVTHSGQYHWVNLDVHSMRRPPALSPSTGPPLSPGGTNETAIGTSPLIGTDTERSVSPEGSVRVPMNRAEINAIESLAKKIYESGYKNQPLNPSGIRESEIRDNVAEIISAAENGLPAAQYILGLCYRSGAAGLARDEERFKDLIRQSAESGCIPAMFIYGMNLEDRDNPGAISEEMQYWHRRGAEGGDAACQYRMGIYTLSNRAESNRWMQLSADQGYLQAIDYLKR